MTLGGTGTSESFKTISLFNLYNRQTIEITGIFPKIAYFSRKSKIISAAFPDPFIMMTGSLFCSTPAVCAIVSMSPSQTIIAIGTGIPSNK